MQQQLRLFSILWEKRLQLFWERLVLIPTQMASYYQSIPRVVYFVLKDYSQIVGTGGFAPVFLAVAEL